MHFAHRVRRVLAILAASAFVATASAANAQEISETHLASARAAIDAINATDQFDMVIPQATQALMQELIQQNPDLQDLVISTVREKALALSSRRGDLEKEAALAYARAFSQAELDAITAFYTSEAGKKLLSTGPIVARELVKAAEIWQRGVARDLAVEVGKHLQQVVNVRPKPQAGNQAPAPDAAPVDVTPAPAQ
jgi:uncharacterized protein